MKRLRATARIDPEHAPAFFNLLANSEAVEEARILEVNTTIDGVETLLFAIDGDASAFAERAADTTGVEFVEVSRVTDDRAYALLVLRPLQTPLFAAIHGASSGAGFVIRTPIRYRDGAMHGEVVGDPERLQAGLDDAPDSMTVQVEEIGRFRGRSDHAESLLSDRQHEAVSVALALGYYDRPRGATQDDVAAELDCAPQTAGDHLRRAEAKLVRAWLSDFGPDG